MKKAKWMLTAALAMGLSAGCSMMKKEKHEKEEEGDEVKMSLQEIPAAAREGLMREAGADAKITTVDKEMKNGKTVYETDVMMGGKTWEIVVDGDGKLVSKKMEGKEEEEKEEKEEKK